MMIWFSSQLLVEKQQNMSKVFNISKFVFFDIFYYFRPKFMSVKLSTHGRPFRFCCNFEISSLGAYKSTPIDQTLGFPLVQILQPFQYENRLVWRPFRFASKLNQNIPLMSRVSCIDPRLGFPMILPKLKFLI